MLPTFDFPWATQYRLAFSKLTNEKEQTIEWLSDWEICLSCAEFPKSTVFPADLKELRYSVKKRSCIVITFQTVRLRFQQ